MIVFIHEEQAYRSWLARHRHGFVLDWLQLPTRKRPTIHRATCDDIRLAPNKRTHWTTGRHLKACGLDLSELCDWVRGESTMEPKFCPRCQPEADAPVAQVISRSPQSERAHFTQLGQSIVDYTLEIAVMRLDGISSEYRVTVNDVAQCLGKTPAQLNAAVLRLIEDDYLRLEPNVEPGATIRPAALIFPTARALRTLPAFGKLSDRELATELERL